MADSPCLQVLGAARRGLSLFSVHLQPAYLRDTQWLEALRRFLLSSDRAHLRVFVLNEGPALGYAAQFMELARLMPSRVELRARGVEQEVDVAGEWLIADEHSLWERRGAEGAPERLLLDQPGAVRPTLALFQRIWDASEPAQELREQHL